jgi:hypothetical protein
LLKCCSTHAVVDDIDSPVIRATDDLFVEVCLRINDDFIGAGSSSQLGLFLLSKQLQILWRHTASPSALGGIQHLPLRRE